MPLTLCQQIGPEIQCLAGASQKPHNPLNRPDVIGDTTFHVGRRRMNVAGWAKRGRRQERKEGQPVR